MSSNLTTKDYINILKYYKLSIPRSKQLIKKNAERILNTKLCKCIKKVDPNNEKRSIAICTKTLFSNKGYRRGRFTCVGKRTIKLKKNKTHRKRRLNI
jgi:hypothetical protein